MFETSVKRAHAPGDIIHLRLVRNSFKQHFGEIKNKVFFKERGLLSLKGPVR